MTRRRLILFAPLAVICLLFGMFLYRLAAPGDELVQSQLVGRSIPPFKLPPATTGVQGLTDRDLATGEPRLLNIFASWCVPCKAEAPVLDTLAKSGVRIDGIAIRDRPADVAQFLAEHGNPFTRIGSDQTSSVQIALGSSGVPETFIIDGKGVIRRQIQGVILPADVPALIAELEALK